MTGTIKDLHSCKDDLTVLFGLSPLIPDKLAGDPEIKHSAQCNWLSKLRYIIHILLSYIMCNLSIHKYTYVLKPKY